MSVCLDSFALIAWLQDEPGEMVELADADPEAASELLQVLRDLEK